MENMAYYLDPHTKDVYAYSKDTSEEDIKRLEPRLLDINQNLIKIPEEDLHKYINENGENKINGLLEALKSEIEQGYTYASTCNKCMKELRYHGNTNDIYHNRNYTNSRYGNYLYQEEQTFDTQYEEAIAYKKSGYKDKSLCPNLIVLSSARGRDLNATVDKIIEKRETKVRRQFKALGLKQKYMDIVENNADDYNKLQHLYDTRETWILF